MFAIVMLTVDVNVNVNVDNECGIWKLRAAEPC